MRVFRIEREKYLKSTLKGIGAALTEGFRWNSQNTYLVYTSESRALATLEVAAHLDVNEDLPKDRFYVEIDIPGEIEILTLKIDDLPSDWNSQPPTLTTQFIGDDFVKDLEAAVLKVPSSIVPPESNYLINPLHPDASKITVVSTSIMSFDRRITPQ